MTTSSDVTKSMVHMLHLVGANSTTTTKYGTTPFFLKCTLNNFQKDLIVSFFENMKNKKVDLGFQFKLLHIFAY